MSFHDWRFVSALGISANIVRLEAVPVYGSQRMAREPAMDSLPAPVGMSPDKSATLPDLKHGYPDYQESAFFAYIFEDELSRKRWARGCDRFG
jgi:hypothetical protein